MMRSVDIVCIESSGSTEARGTSGGTDSLAQRCVKRACVVSCSCTDISSSALTGRLGGTKSGPRRDVASGCGGQKEIALLGYRVLRGSQPVISSSQAPSGASVCLVRSRNVLCGKRRTRSWKLVASVSAILHNLFSDSERERRCCTAHRTREVPSVIQTTPFTRTPSAVVSLSYSNTRVLAQGTHHLSFSNPCVCQISNTSTIHLLPSASKVGLDLMKFSAMLFKLTAPLRCTFCTTLPSLGDAAWRSRPQLQHCTEQDQDSHKSICLTVSFTTATATERILDFDVSHCEP